MDDWERIWGCKGHPLVAAVTKGIKTLQAAGEVGNAPHVPF